MENSKSASTPLINDICFIEILNITCFATFSYVLLLLIIYTRWSPNTQNTYRKRALLKGHNTRCILLLCLFLLHLSEFGDYMLCKGSTCVYQLLTPLTALLVNVILHIFYNEIESNNNNNNNYSYIIIINIIFALICAFSRGAQFLSILNIPLHFTHVRYVTALTTSLLYYLFAANQFYSLYKQLKNKNKVESDEKCNGAYSHHFSSWYSKITFAWLMPILRIGYNLKPGHFGSLPHIEKSSTQYFKFLQILNSTTKGNNNDKKKISLWRCYIKGYSSSFAFGGLLKLFGDVIGLIPPLGISLVVKYIENLQKDNQRPQGAYMKIGEYISNGYVMAVIVLLALLAQGSFSQGSTHVMNTQGIRLKNALQALIYSKLIRIRKSSLEKQEKGEQCGQITNLMSEDVYNVMSCFWIGHYIWAIPLKVILIVYLLYLEIGWSAVIGCSVCILIMVPIQFIVGKKMSMNSKLTSECTDNRLRIMNETLQGIRFIKLYCWENEFYDKIKKIRQTELKHLHVDSIYWVIITFLTNASSAVIALTTMIVFYAMEEESIDAASLFTSLALFNQLTVPLFIFPIMLPIITSAIVSTKRLEEFLSVPEVGKAINIPVTTISESKQYLTENETEGCRLRKITENSEEDLDDDDTTNDVCNDQQILIVKKALSSWSDNEMSSITIDCLEIKRGTLNIIIGDVGSGKSSFIYSILREMEVFSGKIIWNRNVKIAYVAQNPWLFTGTIRDNILFGYPYDESRLRRIVSSCALTADFNILPDKEMTNIGEEGICLSSGQKQRIALARALYSDADVYIMDDPLSCLDNIVADHVFHQCILKSISKLKKTIILTCNSKKMLSYANQIIVMKNGNVHATGSLSEICKLHPEEMSKWGSFQKSQTSLKKAPDEITLIQRQLQRLHVEQFYSSADYSGSQAFLPLRRRMSMFSGSRYFTHDLPLPTDECEPDVFEGTSSVHQTKRERAATVTDCPPNHHKAVFRASSLQPDHTASSISKSRYMSEQRVNIRQDHRRLLSTTSIFSEDFDQTTQYSSDENMEWDIKYDTEELQTEKDVTIGTYMSYIRSSGLSIIVMYFIVTLCWQTVRVVTDFWLGYIVSNDTVLYQNWTMMWHLCLYTTLSAAAVILSLLSNSFGQYAASNSRENLHNNMIDNIIHCPITFFNNTLFGKMINRFSIDVDIIDKKIATSAQRLIQFQLLCLSAIIVNFIITPWFLVLVVPISLLYYVVQKYYRRTARELQRQDSILRSPAISHFSETLSGLETIRAYGHENRYMEILFQKMDIHTNVFLILNSTNRWLGIALDYLGGVIVFVAMLVSITSVTIFPNVTTPVFVGLAINYTLLIPIYLNWVVKFLSDLELYMAAVGRILRYSKIPRDDDQDEGNTPSNWPTKGAIKFVGVTLSYSPEVCVISKLDLYIPAGQKVGICGRTGSGKSSLMLSLIRMIPTTSGIISIDNINISEVPIKLLRSSIAIIPQDVMMFSGTIRENMDIRHEYSDNELWSALKLVHMEEVVIKLGGLEAAVQEGGLNLSVGEKQLLCLARAILFDAVCLILDEATSSLHPNVEKEFLTTATNLFSKRTVIAVTHRVSSLLNFDRILVLESQKIVEDGAPSDLKNKRAGRFSSMLKLTEIT